MFVLKFHLRLKHLINILIWPWTIVKLLIFRNHRGELNEPTLYVGNVGVNGKCPLLFQNLLVVTARIWERFLISSFEVQFNFNGWWFQTIYEIWIGEQFKKKPVWNTWWHLILKEVKKRGKHWHCLSAGLSILLGSELL